MSSAGPSPISWRAVIRAAITGPLVPDLEDEDRALLERAAHSGPRPAAVRAEIVLAATTSRPATEIAADLGVSQLAVLRAVRRYRNNGAQALINPLG